MSWELVFPVSVFSGLMSGQSMGCQFSADEVQKNSCIWNI